MKIKNNLTRIELAKSLSKKKGIPILLSKKIIDDLIQIIINNIKQENFLLKNIGTFKILKKTQREGRNPKTGKIHTIYPRKSISFVASKSLKKKMNN